jgi:hypothetical protein
MTVFVDFVKILEKIKYKELIVSTLKYGTPHNRIGIIFKRSVAVIFRESAKGKKFYFVEEG